MPSVHISGFNMSRNEMLLVAYSNEAGAWVASVGEADADEQRVLTYGDTPEEALGLLFTALGCGKIEAS